MLTPKGLLVNSLVFSIASVNSSWVGYMAAARQASPPALATADTNSGLLTAIMVPH